MLGTPKVNKTQPQTQSASSEIIDGLRSLALNISVIPSYLYWRSRIILVNLWLLVDAIGDLFMSTKSYLVRRMFWGRSGLYKSSFHIAVISLSTIFLVTNFASRLAIIPSAQAAEELTFSSASSGNKDLLEQGNTLTSIVAINPDFPEFTVRKYIVQPHDTLDAIAKDAGISKDTIKWANNKVLTPFNDNLNVGWVLDIPEMNGVLYTAEKGDSIDSVIKKTGGNKDNIIELNRLYAPNYTIAEGQRLFIPDGELKPPPPKPVAYNPGYIRTSSVDFDTAMAALRALPAGTFGNPLMKCSGYHFSRGLLPNHNGVDWAKSGGCPIVAAAAGRVKYAGWSTLSGFNVILDHGTGIETHYFHAAPDTFKVKIGDYVQKGQDLMYMGCTGRCTGTHLHFELYVGHRYLNPLDYVPF